MKLLDTFRNFLFPFDQESLDVPDLRQKTPQYSYISRPVDLAPTKEDETFEASDGFLYLNHL